MASLHNDLQDLCFLLYSENAVAFSCVERMASNLVRNGLEATRDGEEATPEFQDVVDKYYQPFCKDIVREILLYGIVSWGTQMVNDQLTVPVVLAGNTVQYTYSYKRKRSFRPDIQGIHSPSGQKVPHVAVYTPPDLKSKTIRSAISRCVPMHIFENRMLVHAEVAERKIAGAPVVLENTAANSGFWAYKATERQETLPAFGGFDTTDLGDNSAEEFQREFRDNVKGVDETLMRLQDSYTRKLNTIGSIEEIEMSQLQNAGKAGKDDIPKLQLPPHTRASTLAMNHTRSDLVAIMSVGAERISTAMGIPSRALSNTQSVVGADALKSYQKQLDEATAVFRPFVNILLTEALEVCTGPDDFLYGILTNNPRFAKRPTLKLRKNTAQTNDLIDLYKQGLIERDCVLKQIEAEFGICGSKAVEEKPVVLPPKENLPEQTNTQKNE
jgi:hypothetical protein